jgi:hypothetical protein
VVYERTVEYPPDAQRNNKKLEAVKPPLDWQRLAIASYAWTNSNDYSMSRKFQWLPTDFIVSPDGKSAKTVDYINNLHPIRHSELHNVLEEIVAAYIPLFEHVLTDTIFENNASPQRTSNKYSWEPRKPFRPTDIDLDSQEFQKIRKDWKKNRSIVLPDVTPYRLGSLEGRALNYKISGRKVQIVVKLANIVLVGLWCWLMICWSEPYVSDARKPRLPWGIMARGGHGQ